MYPLCHGVSRSVPFGSIAHQHTVHSCCVCSHQRVKHVPVQNWQEYTFSTLEYTYVPCDAIPHLNSTGIEDNYVIVNARNT